MPTIKVIDSKPAPSIARTVCYNNQGYDISDENAIKKAVYDYGREIVIEVDGNWIDAKDYFEDELRSVTQTAEIENVEESNKFEEVFSGHWMKQVSNAKEEFDTPEELEEALEYARKNNISTGVINRLEEHLDALS